MSRFVDSNGAFAPSVLHVNGQTIINPTPEQYLANGYVEYVAPTAEPYVPTYEERVVEIIRQKYTIDEELAILRQRDTKADEFAEYNEYCEAAKATAKAETETE